MAEPTPHNEGGKGSAGRKRNRRRAPAAVYGAIDLGTNNCRMLLARRSGSNFQVVDAFSRVVRLGEGLTTSLGDLLDEATASEFEDSQEEN